MTNTSKTAVFFGSGPVASESLRFLAGHFSIEAVITKPVPPHHKFPAPVEELARSLDLPILFAANKADLDEIFSSHNFSSPIGIIVDFGVIVSEKVIQAFPLGIINSHFSLLPQWRGADPITFAILSGQNETGVSLMLIEPTLDTGKLIAQQTIEIDPADTTQSLTSKLVELSNKMLLEYLPKYIDDHITPFDQLRPENATYSRKLSKTDSLIDRSKPAAVIEREIRAFIGWPGSKTQINGHNIIVTKAHIVDQPQDKLDILAGDGKYLSIDELIAPSGRKMTANAFINGYFN